LKILSASANERAGYRVIRDIRVKKVVLVLKNEESLFFLVSK